MGAIFSVPVARARDADALPRPRVALDAHGATPLHEVAPQAATLLVGAEREGLPDEVRERCETVARIPIDRAESLNAAMAATVALYERHRMAHP
jgi:TrmH family RNA methyltransferase